MQKSCAQNRCPVIIIDANIETIDRRRRLGSFYRQHQFSAFLIVLKHCLYRIDRIISELLF